MSTSLAEFIQKKLEYPPLRKVDPVDHNVKTESASSGREKLAQAGIATVLAFLYRYTGTQNSSRAILANDPGDGSWLDRIIQDKSETINKVAGYAGVSSAEAEDSMKKMAREAVLAIREVVAQNPAGNAIQKYMNDERQAILLYLPAAMQLGDLLENNAPIVISEADPVHQEA